MLPIFLSPFLPMFYLIGHPFFQTLTLFAFPTGLCAAPSVQKDKQEQSKRKIIFFIRERSGKPNQTFQQGNIGKIQLILLGLVKEVTTFGKNVPYSVSSSFFSDKTYLLFW
ncbi:hypothetical protein BLX87_20765 [Bacillus sp. VT-16-64]|nr:hypothetical protein BLX87_20765 [Bacillus sp. VT-16-64]